MEVKYNLTSSLGEFFSYIIYIIGVGFLGFLIYSIITKDKSAIFTIIFLCIFLYFTFINKLLKFKKITFDKKFIYFDNKSVSLKKIENIKDGKLIIRENGQSVKITYNYFYGQNLKLLKQFCESENNLDIKPAHNNG